MSKKLLAVPLPWVAALGVITLLSVAVGIAALMTKTQKRLPKTVCNGANAVVRAAAQWSTHAQQDASPLLRMVHVNYAIAQLNALRVILSDADIERITTIKPREMVASLREQQSQAIRKVGDACSSLKLQGLQGQASGWR